MVSRSFRSRALKGLVEQQQLRAHRKGARNSDTLLLAAGKRLYGADSEVAHMDEIEKALHRSLRFVARRPAGLEAEGDVLRDGKWGKSA